MIDLRVDRCRPSGIGDRPCCWRRCSPIATGSPTMPAAVSNRAKKLYLPSAIGSTVTSHRPRPLFGDAVRAVGTDDAIADQHAGRQPACRPHRTPAQTHSPWRSPDPGPRTPADILFVTSSSLNMPVSLAASRSNVPPAGESALIVTHSGGDAVLRPIAGSGIPAASSWPSKIFVRADTRYTPGCKCRRRER